jgi:hypothetical protein
MRAMQNHAPAQPAIPVICDACRARGIAGEEGFADLGDLLDFTPVPRKKQRVDGWDAERQRAFIIALAYTGSKRRAAHAVGKAQYGVDQLLSSEGCESFREACDRATAIARETGRSRLAAGVGAVAGEAAAWKPAQGPWANARSRPDARFPVQEEEMTDEQKLDWLADVVRKYLYKVEAERKCRLAGEIVAADFYLRQMTHIEVVLDLMGGDGFKVLMGFREGDYHLVHIAETPFSRILDDARRAKWAELGEPPRPEHPPRRYLEDHGRFSSEPLETTRGGQKLSHDEQKRLQEEQHARDAVKQIEWEAWALRDYEARSAASKAHDA